MTAFSIVTLLLGLGGLLQAQVTPLPKIIQRAEVDTIELPIELLDVSEGLSQVISAH